MLLETRHWAWCTKVKNTASYNLDTLVIPFLAIRAARYQRSVLQEVKQERNCESPRPSLEKIKQSMSLKDVEVSTSKQGQIP
jgi:hypothetical protein